LEGTVAESVGEGDVNADDCAAGHLSGRGVFHRNAPRYLCSQGQLSELIFLPEGEGLPVHSGEQIGKKQKLDQTQAGIPCWLSPNMPLPTCRSFPSYMKVEKTEKDIHYHVAESAFPDPRRKVRSLNELTVVSHQYLSFPLPQILLQNFINEGKEYVNRIEKKLSRSNFK